MPFIFLLGGTNMNEEARKNIEKLIARHDELMKLPTKEFLSEYVTKEIEYIHKQLLINVKKL